MAGIGPAPKPENRRVRAKSGGMGMQFRLVAATPTGQPQLPDFTVQVSVDGVIEEQSFQWPERTRGWWRMWAESPLSKDFTDSDWDFLLDTALLHAKVWGHGQLSLMSELRIRVAKFGATPEDRLRLRIQFATADEVEEKAKRTKEKSSRSRARLVKAV